MVWFGSIAYDSLFIMAVIMTVLKYLMSKEKFSIGMKILLIGFIVYAIPAFSPTPTVEFFTGTGSMASANVVLNILFIIGLIVYMIGLVKVLVESVQQ